MTSPGTGAANIEYMLLNMGVKPHLITWMTAVCSIYAQRTAEWQALQTVPCLKFTWQKCAQNEHEAAPCVSVKDNFGKADNTASLAAFILNQQNVWETHETPLNKCVNVFFLINQNGPYRWRWAAPKWHPLKAAKTNSQSIKCIKQVL